MWTILSELRTKIRALIFDLLKNDFESFTYESGDTIFVLAESNIGTISSVTQNGVALASGDYSYDSTTNELEITASMSANDIIIVKYTYYKYSSTELDEYIRASLVWISVFSYCETDFELEDEDISPTPSNKQEDLISLIASILIKPDYSEYRLPNLVVRYPRTMAKEDRIEKTIVRFQRGLGVNDLLTFD